MLLFFNLLTLGNSFAKQFKSNFYLLAVMEALVFQLRVSFFYKIYRVILNKEWFSIKLRCSLDTNKVSSVGLLLPHIVVPDTLNHKVQEV